MRSHLIAISLLGLFASAGALAGPQVYVLPCGQIKLASPQNFGIADDETDIRQLVTTCYVVKHEQGTLLWDAGLPSALAGQGWQGDDEFQQQLERSLADKLADIDVDLASLDYFAFSHSHFDHVGAANDITSGTWLVQEAEYDAVFAEEVTVPAVNPDLLTGLKGLTTQKLNGDHDVFGDGTVKIISAPGHTPGHQVLWVNLENSGPVLISGDLWHFRISRSGKRVPVFNVSSEETLQSMAKVEALIDETGAEVWIQHDALGLSERRQAPEYYD